MDSICSGIICGLAWGNVGECNKVLMGKITSRKKTFFDEGFCVHSDNSVFMINHANL